MIGLVVVLVSVSLTLPIPLVLASEIPLIAERFHESMAPAYVLVAV